jgi:hypothetical protein
MVVVVVVVAAVVVIRANANDWRSDGVVLQLCDYSGCCRYKPLLIGGRERVCRGRE